MAKNKSKVHQESVSEYKPIKPASESVTPPQKAVDSFKKADAIDVTFPENLSAYLTPLMILIGSAMISVSILYLALRITPGSAVQTTTNTSSGSTSTTTSTAQAKTASLDDIKALFDKDTIKFGDKNAKLIFVEISDPSRPYCQIASGKNPSLNKSAGSRFTLVSDGGTYVAPVEEIEKLVKDGKASFVFLCSNGHGSGELAAQSLYCANEKGKYWEVNNKIMSNDGYNIMNSSSNSGNRLSSEELSSFLSSVVDKDFMKSCLDSGKYKPMIARDQALADSLGSQGTPGFFVNDKMFAGAYSYTDMKDFVDASLK